MQWEQFRCNIDCKNYPKDCISENLFVDMIDRLADDGWLEYGYDVQLHSHFHMFRWSILMIAG